MKGTFDQNLVDTLTKAFVGPVITTQTTISNWYATMADSYLNALRLNTIEIAYFYILLPLGVNRHYDPEMIGAWKVLQMSSGESAFEISKDPLAARKLPI